LVSIGNKKENTVWTEPYLVAVVISVYGGMAIAHETYNDVFIPMNSEEKGSQ